jgi:hypothetical protein
MSYGTRWRRERRLIWIVTVILVAGCGHAPRPSGTERTGPETGGDSASSNASGDAPSRATQSPIPSEIACPLVVAPSIGLRVRRRVDLGNAFEPWELATDEGGRLWTLSRDSDSFAASSITRFDPESDKLSRPIELNIDAWDLAADEHTVWVTTNTPDGRVIRIDADEATVDGEVTGDRPLGPNILAAFGSVWTTENTADTADEFFITRIDAETDEATARIQVGLSPQSLGVGGGAVWTGNHDDSSVSRIDPTNDRATTTFLGETPHEVAGGDTTLWIAASHSARVLSLDYTTGRTGTICLPFNPLPIAMVPKGLIWIASSRFDAEQQTDELALVDEATGKVRRVEHLGARPSALSVSGGSLWVLAREPNQLIEIATGD